MVVHCIPRVGGQDHPITQEIRSGFRLSCSMPATWLLWRWETIIKAAGLLHGDGVGFVFVGEGRAQIPS